MAHECPPFAPEQRVEEIGQDPAALAVLVEAGINHCCGRHLTLAEAAAAAGVPLGKLLARLNRIGRQPA